MSKKELVLRAIRGETVERIPVGFWLHYVTQEEKELGLDNPAVVEKSIKGHQHYHERWLLPLSECSLFERDQIDPRIEGYSTDWRASSMD